MRLILIASALSLTLPSLAVPTVAAAEEAAAPAEQPAKPPRKICRSEPSATGIDMSGGTPTRSQGNRQD